MGRHLSPRYVQVILVNGYLVLIWCQLITILICNQFSPGLPKKLASVKVNIGFPVVQTDGLSGERSVGRCTVTWLPNFLGWVDLLSYGAPPTQRAHAAPLQLQCKMIMHSNEIDISFDVFSSPFLLVHVSFFVVNFAVSAASEYMIFTQKLSTVWIQSPYTSIHISPAEIGAKSFILSLPSLITQVVVTLFYMIFLAWFKWLICKFRTPCFC